MSLRLRVGSILQMLFVINPDGLSIKDFERMIKISEGEYFQIYDAQSGIIDGLDFMKKSPLERRVLNKHNSYERLNLWEYKEGKYYPNEKTHLDDESKKIIENIEKGEKIENIENYDHYCLFQDKIISILKENKEGIEFNNLYTNFNNFYSILKRIIKKK